MKSLVLSALFRHPARQWPLITNKTLATVRSERSRLAERGVPHMRKAIERHYVTTCTGYGALRTTQHLRAAPNFSLCLSLFPAALSLSCLTETHGPVEVNTLPQN